MSNSNDAGETCRAVRVWTLPMSRHLVSGSIMYEDQYQVTLGMLLPLYNPVESCLVTNLTINVNTFFLLFLVCCFLYPSRTSI